MATYGREHNPVIIDDIALLREQARRDIFDFHESPTRVVLQSVSGTINAFTEEITHHEATTYFNASGVVGHIAEDDVLLGDEAGRVVVGDLSIVYPYDVISGVFLANRLRQIEVLAVAASGLYTVSSHAIESFGNEPIFLKVSLKLDPNG